jgi:hypothetical protein
MKTTIASLIARWKLRHWYRRQKEFRRTGTRYYGDGGTIHSTGLLNIEIFNGEVVGVWFRCQHLPFDQTEVDDYRATELSRLYANGAPPLHGVEVENRMGGR